jgi:hypothetical protein
MRNRCTHFLNISFGVVIDGTFRDPLLIFLLPGLEAYSVSLSYKFEQVYYQCEGVGEDQKPRLPYLMRDIFRRRGESRSRQRWWDLIQYGIRNFYSKTVWVSVYWWWLKFSMIYSLFKYLKNCDKSHNLAKLWKMISFNQKNVVNFFINSENYSYEALCEWYTPQYDLSKNYSHF